MFGLSLFLVYPSTTLKYTAGHNQAFKTTKNKTRRDFMRENIIFTYLSLYVKIHTYILAQCVCRCVCVCKHIPECVSV